MQGISGVFSRAKPIVGVVHLLPLLGSPRQASPSNEVRVRALADAEALIDNGIDGVIVENYGDAPFFPGLRRGAHRSGYVNHRQRTS